MFGLSEQVEREWADAVRAAVPVCNQEQVARARETVDPDDAGQLALGLLDVQVARTDDHIDPADRLGPVRERGDRLGAAHPIRARRARERTGGEDRGVDLARGVGRSAHRDVGHAGRARRDDPHNDRARIGCAAAGHVHRGPVDRRATERHVVAAEGHRDPLAGLRRRLDGHGADVLDCLLKAVPHTRVELLERARRRRVLHPERERRGVCRVEPARVFEDGLVAPVANLIDDLGDRRLDGG